MIDEIEIDYNTFRLIINPDLISIDKSRIIEILGYTSTPKYFDSVIDDVIYDTKTKLNVKAGFKIFENCKVSNNQKSVVISNIFFNTEQIVTYQLGEIEKVAVFVLTAGYEIDKWIKELNSNGETLLSYLADITASELAEKIADILHDYISSKMKIYGLNVTNRFSPGYCNWNVSEQHKLFSLLPDNFCDIKLTESALMVPSKSISGIIGIGKKAKWDNYLCEKCGVKDCTYRIKVILKRTKDNN